ncbi:MAG: organomercurial lyase [Gemmatimonadota bacterium]
MINTERPPADSLDHAVRMFVFERAALAGTIPQVVDVARALVRAPEEIAATLQRLAATKVLILAPNGGEIWAANPFCSVPSGFRVETNGNHYWGICVWDALGIVAALNVSEASVRAPCGDCGELLQFEFQAGELVHADGLIHFAVPARDWWKNIGFA